jgi:hypothetical protein
MPSTFGSHITDERHSSIKLHVSQIALARAIPALSIEAGKKISGSTFAQG